MKVFDKVRVPIASHKPINIDLSCVHTTTSDFMRVEVPYIRRCVAKEKLKMNVSAFARLAGMPLPTFGEASLNLRAFFVPYRMVFPAYNDFMEGTYHTYSDGNSAVPLTAPYFTNRDLVDLLILNSDVVPLTTPDFDYEAKTPTGSGSYMLKQYKFKPAGRRIYKLFRQLGYAPYFDLEAAAAAGYDKLCALDLLAYVKVYIDYYWPSAYYDDQVRLDMDGACLMDDYTTASGGFQLDLNRLASIVAYIGAAPYGNDYFTSAFDFPVGSNTVEPVISLRDTTVYNPSTSVEGAVRSQNLGVMGSVNGTPTIYSVNKSNGAANAAYPSLSQYALMALRKLTDFVTRHRLVGSRAVDRFLAQYGIKLDNDKARRSTFLGSHHVPLVVADVMATSDTYDSSTGAGVALGDYAGKGFLVGQDGDFTCDCGDDAGVFIVLSSIVPHIGYYQGYDHQTLNRTRLDFYTPEFDGLGNRGIEKGELFVPHEIMTAGSTTIRGVFGFTPQYSEYKLPKSRLTGDFVINTLNKAGFTSNSWHLFRDCKATNYDNIQHNLAFLFENGWIGDDTQYNRIFYSQTNDADHFVLNYRFKVTSNLPVKPLFDSYEFEHEDGGMVELPANGSKVN